MHGTFSLKPLSDTKTKTAHANRSLERGISILRAFRPGSDFLGNNEIAERTGLARSTVSRLMQTLAANGVLEIEPGTRVYRLAPFVLSLAHAMRSGSRVLSIAAPMMKSTAEKYKINVGLAVPDQDEMVYLESFRHNVRPSLRKVVSGQRVPMELTSLGRSFLTVAPKEQRLELFDHFSKTRATQWPNLLSAIEQAMQNVHEYGYCIASWQSEVVALATPIIYRTQVYALNVSVFRQGAVGDIAQELEPVLMHLRSKIIAGLEMNQDN